MNLSLRLCSDLQSILMHSIEEFISKTLSLFSLQSPYYKSFVPRLIGLSGIKTKSRKSTKRFYVGFG